MYIYNPITYENHDIYSKYGIKLLKTYVQLFQSGGGGGK
jgi:hypothetical protein